MKLLFLSTPVAPLGSGIGGGVELTLKNLALEMLKRGHQVLVLAPQDSKLEGISLVEVEGEIQIAAQTLTRDTPVVLPDNSALANLWDYARAVEQDWDLIVNFAFDWLPFYLTPFFHIPIAHFISMGSMTEALDRIMNRVARDFPHTIGVYTRTQAETFPFCQQCRILGSGIDLSLYQFQARPQNSLAWLGRIAPEKALEDAVRAAQITGIPLKIFGKIQDEEYWQQICRDYADAPMEYRGFLGTEELQAQLRDCRALLMTPRWVEAFGNVAIEALACGVPIIAYRRGGPAEIVREGKTGFLVEPDSVEGLIEGIARIDEIDRSVCRQQAEHDYGLGVWGDRFEAWFRDILKSG
ncbi:glycosyltransferase family 4 protein [Oscillatoria sp. FACHB-1406]|uniref:glycosyltransferase family 4 protein n=1 Tax=Oscillatoria sp. FACHB-1406 TaxID=2692846 RepID=UPI00321FBCCF